MAQGIEFTFTNADDEEEVVTLPSKWCICGGCNGDGTSSAYLGAITMSDREPGGSWEDPDEFRDYMSGAYDRECERCIGTGKVRVVDEECCNPVHLKAYNDHLEEERDYERMCEAERRAGA
jgi:hypothetical protein